MIGQTRQETDQLIFGAGVGAAKMSRPGYAVARYYHWIVAAFTCAVVLLEMIPIAAPRTIALWIGLYLLYFTLRQLMSERVRLIFYRPEFQLLRAQVSVIVVSLLIASLGPAGTATTLLLLFVLMLQAVSKHCRSWAYLITLAETWLALLLLAAHSLGQDLFSMQAFTAEVAVPCLWITVLSFMIHYLVRNVDARTDTIARYEMINALSSKLESLTDSDAKWRAALQTCVQVVQGYSGSLWFCDYNTQTLRLVAEHCDRGKTNKADTKLDTSPESCVSLRDNHVLSNVARDGQPSYCILASQEATCQGEIALRQACPQVFQDLYSMMTIPIADGTNSDTTRTMAVLCVGFKRSAPPRSTLLDAYQTMLMNMVHYIKPVLHYERVVQELKALQQIGGKALRGSNLDEVLKSILEETVNTLGFEFATISLVDEDERLIRTTKGIHVPERWIAMAIHPLDGNDIQADIIRTGKTEVIEAWDDRFDRRIWRKFGHKNAIRVFAPIKVYEHDSDQQRVIGTIEAGYWRESRAVIDDQQLAMLQSFITQAAVAIEKAQLFERMEQRNRALTSLHSVSQAISTARSLPQVLQEIGVSAEKVLGAQIVMLYRYNEENHRLEPPLISGTVWGKRPLNLDIKEDSILARIIRDKVPYYSSDALTDPYLTDYARPTAQAAGTKYRNFTQRQDIKSFAGVPLLANGHIVGVMCVNYRKRHRFARDEQQIVELFAQQAAIAIKNAEVNALNQELAVREERARLSRELHDSLAQDLPAICLMIDNVESLLPESPDRARYWLHRIRQTAEAARKKVSFSVFQLGSVGLQEGLRVDMASLCELIEECYGLQVDTDVDMPAMLHPTIENTVYLVVREALINAARHAHACLACVKIGVRNEYLYFWVRDDGCGFDTTLIDTRGSHGLNSMRDRIRMLGGRLHVGPNDRGGTLVVGQLPIGRDTDDRNTAGADHHFDRRGSSDLS